MKLDGKRDMVRARFISALAQVVVAVGLTLGSAVVRADAIDDYMQSEMQKQHIPGLSRFISQLDRFVDDKVTIIVLTNIDAADTGAIAKKVAEIYFQEH